MKTMQCDKCGREKCPEGKDCVCADLPKEAKESDGFPCHGDCTPQCDKCGGTGIQETVTYYGTGKAVRHEFACHCNPEPTIDNLSTHPDKEKIIREALVRSDQMQKDYLLRTDPEERAEKLVAKGITEMKKRCSDNEMHCSCTAFAIDFVKEDIAKAIRTAQAEVCKVAKGAAWTAGLVTNKDVRASVDKALAPFEDNGK